MFKRGMALLALLFIFGVIPSVFADGAWSVDLIAGQNITIGSVDFAIDGDTFTATFNVTTAGWCLETTHLYVGDVAPERAAPGQFQYQHDELDCVTSDSYTVPAPTGDVFVAAHAESDFDPARAQEPDPIGTDGTLNVSIGSSSYFDATVDVDGLLTNLPAWCVDLEHFITPGSTYDVAVSLSGEALVDRADNLDLILYLINQDYTTWGATAYDIQVAIWLLIDDQTPIGISSTALAIRDDALANGDGFTPSCGQLTGVFLDPGADVQNIMVIVPAPCEIEGTARAETAWGLSDWGVAFAQGWGMYFQLIDVPDPDPTDPPAPEPVPTEDPVVEDGNRARNDEAPGTNPDNPPPGDRSDESRGNGNGNSNGNNNTSNNSGGNANGNGNGRGN